jgi:hypothetical protein
MPAFGRRRIVALAVGCFLLGYATHMAFGTWTASRLPTVDEAFPLSAHDIELRDRCLASGATRDACDAVLRIVDRERVRRATAATTD